MVVGYTGGKEPNPTYKSILDSTEALLVEFDPDVISFGDLLLESVKQYNPYIKSWTRQYRAAVWVQNKKQRDIATTHVENLTKQQHGFAKNVKPRKVYVDVEDVGPFYRAEEYHQNYIQNHLGLLD